MKIETMSAVLLMFFTLIISINFYLKTMLLKKAVAPVVTHKCSTALSLRTSPSKVSICSLKEEYDNTKKLKTLISNGFTDILQKVPNNDKCGELLLDLFKSTKKIKGYNIQDNKQHEEMRPRDIINAMQAIQIAYSDNNKNSNNVALNNKMVEKWSRQNIIVAINSIEKVMHWKIEHKWKSHTLFLWYDLLRKNQHILLFINSHLASILLALLSYMVYMYIRIIGVTFHFLIVWLLLFN